MVQAAFLSLLSHEAAVVSARPHMLETAAPALQGPLNRGAESLKVKPTRCAACTMAVTSAVHSSNDSSSSSSSEFWSGGTGHEAATGQLGFSVVATGFSNGVVYAHALEIGQVVPVWLDSAPACVFDHRGEVAAVRYEVDAVAVMPALAAGEGQMAAAAAGMAVAAVNIGVSCMLLVCQVLCFLDGPFQVCEVELLYEGLLCLLCHRVLPIQQGSLWTVL